MVIKENIDYCLSKIKDEKTKKDLIGTVSKFDIRISTKLVIKVRKFSYNIWIWEKHTKRRRHFILSRLEFLKREKMETIPNLIYILNALGRWLDTSDELRDCYEILPKDSANEYSMLSINWKRLFS